MKKRIVTIILLVSIMLTFLIPAFAAPPTTAKFSTSLASDTVAAFRTIDEAKNHGLKIADAYLKQ